MTRSTNPASTSRSDGFGSIFMNPVARLGVSHQQALYGDGNPVDSPSLNIVRRFDSWRAFDTLHHKNCCDSSLRFYEATMKR